MGDYQKELAIHKLEKATEILVILTSKERACFAPECQDELQQVMDLLKKTREDVVNI